jgi:DNA (cytosine-5)-methyltransferase 1
MGYHRAGFEIVGVDIEEQPHYPFTFFQADSIDVLEKLASNELGLLFDAIHASPPCQRYTALQARNKKLKNYPDLIKPTRELLFEVGVPYIIENVIGAPLISPAVICGTERGLGVGKYRLRRHRLFETNWGLSGPRCTCWKDDRYVIDVTGGGHLKTKDGRRPTYKGDVLQAAVAMGIGWMTKPEMNNAIPPAYTEYIGRELRRFWLLKSAEYATRA